MNNDSKRIFYIIYSLFFIVSLTWSTPNIYISFRMDDPSSTSDKILDRKIIETFVNNSVPLTVGIVPFSEDIPLSETHLAFILKYPEKEYIDIALHGYSHENMLLSELPSEFADLSYQEQLIKISRGRDHLESTFNTEIRMFIPPFNTYDENTLKVLEDLDFHYLSAALFGQPYSGTSIKYLPYTVSLLNLKESIIKARTNTAADKEPIIIIVLLHSYDLIEYNLTIQKIESILQWINKQNDIEVLPLESLSTKLNLNYSSSLHQEYIHHRMKTEDIYLFRNRIDPFFNKSTYEPDPLSRTTSIPFIYNSKKFFSSKFILLIRILLVTISFYYLLSLLPYIIFLLYCIYKKNKPSISIQMLILFFIIVLFHFFLWFNNSLGYRWLSLSIFISSSFSITIYCFSIKKMKQNEEFK